MQPSVRLVHVPTGLVPAIWPHVETLLRPAMERSGEMPMGDLASAIMSGRFLLWLVRGNGIEAAAVTEIAETINGKLLCIVACGGTKRARWLHLTKELEEYGRREGCKLSRIYGRIGWKRVLPDYQTKRVILEKAL